MRHYLWTALLIAGLASTWPGSPVAQQTSAGNAERLDGALAFLEHFAVRRIIEAVRVDAGQLHAFRPEPGSDPEVLTISGLAEITDITGNLREHPYKAQVTILCQAYERTGCWSMRSLTLGSWVSAGSSPAIVALADLGEPMATGKEPAPAAASTGEETGQAAVEPAEADGDSGGDMGLLQQRAAAGDPQAQYDLAEAYRLGVPVKQDTAEAMALYHQAAAQNHREALFRLGTLYDQGEIVDRDLAQAVVAYRKAAELDHPGAQYALAHIYHLGSGVPQDMSAALGWYRKAADQGDEWAQLALGDQYRIGVAVPRDLAQSTAWYRMAAERGNIFAQFELGNAYRFGNGVARDLGQAKAWYGRSAEAGNPAAKLAYEELEDVEETAIASVPAVTESPGAIETAETFEGELTSPETVLAASEAELITDAGGSEPTDLQLVEPNATTDGAEASGGDWVAELAYAAEPSYDQDAELARLLDLAQSQLAGLALTTPAGDNAYETYQLVLALDPDNLAALAGIEQIGLKYVSLAERAAARGETDLAGRHAKRAAPLVPGHPNLLALEAALAAPVAPADGAEPGPEAPAPAEDAPQTAALPEPAVAAPAPQDESPAEPQVEPGPIDGVAIEVPPAPGPTAAVGPAPSAKPELLTSGLLYAVSGLDAHKAGNYDEAIEFYSLAIRAGDMPDRSLAYVHNNRGATYRNLNRYNEAIEDYDAAIRLNPDYATAYYNRGIAYDRKGFHGLAIDDFDTAIRLDPDLSDAYNQRGLAYVRDGRYEIAIENFSQAIRLDPELDSAYFNRGLAYHSQGDADRAAADLRKSYTLNPDNPEYGRKMRELGIL